MFQRHVRVTLRLPIWIAVTLVQPIIWLTLYGQLFRRVVELPGFGTASYIQFLTPGIVMMTALFGSAWSGMGLIEDHDNGVLDRMLATPVHRGAFIASRVLQAALTVTVQAGIILVVGLLLGARSSGGVLGLLAILLMAALLAAGISALSNALALLIRNGDSLVAMVQFFGMPLLFVSSAFMAAELMPEWLRFLARGNPVNWAVDAGRQALMKGSWTAVWQHSLFLLIFALAASFLATQAFRSYRHLN